MSPHTNQQTLRDAPSGIGENDSVRENGSPESEVEDFDYVPVPPRKSVSLSVRYRVRGRGQPLPYPVDESTGE
jgi:hypothetical protein